MTTEEIETLVESFVNGNRAYVVETICLELPPTRAAFAAAQFYEALSTTEDRGHNRKVFMRLLEAKAER
jgi:hypothetical protein